MSQVGREHGKERVGVCCSASAEKGKKHQRVLPNPKAPEKCNAAPGKRDTAVLILPATPEHGDHPLPDGSAPQPAPWGKRKGQVGHPSDLPSPVSHLREGQEGMPRRTMTLAGGTHHLARGTDLAVPEKLRPRRLKHVAWQTPEDCVNPVLCTRAGG